MTIHIGAAKTDIAPTVLMPGDPYRAKWAAETFLTDARCINEVRGMLGFTGTWHGHPVTIQGSGMGMPSLSIYANELIKDFNEHAASRRAPTRHGNCARLHLAGAPGQRHGRGRLASTGGGRH